MVVRVSTSVGGSGGLAGHDRQQGSGGGQGERQPQGRAQPDIRHDDPFEAVATRKNTECECVMLPARTDVPGVFNDSPTAGSLL